MFVLLYIDRRWRPARRLADGAVPGVLRPRSILGRGSARRSRRRRRSVPLEPVGRPRQRSSVGSALFFVLRNRRIPTRVTDVDVEFRLDDETDGRRRTPTDEDDADDGEGRPRQRRCSTTRPTMNPTTPGSTTRIPRPLIAELRPTVRRTEVRERHVVVRSLVRGPLGGRTDLVVDVSTGAPTVVYWGRSLGADVDLATVPPRSNGRSCTAASTSSRRCRSCPNTARASPAVRVCSVVAAAVGRGLHASPRRRTTSTDNRLVVDAVDDGRRPRARTTDRARRRRAAACGSR